MAITYSHYKPPISLHSLHQNPASISLNPLSSNCAPKASISAELFAEKRRIQISPIVAAIGDGGVCTPLEPTSSIGKSLCDVLMNDPYSFYDAVSSQLTDLAVDRDNAFGRMELSFGKPEACLHRRIAEMKEAEHSFVIENIMSMIIYKMFKDINVSPTPTIDKSTCKQNWETSSSNDDLKSIHSNEVIETIQGYLTSVLPINPDPIAITNMIALEKLYSSSIYYGYFLKSASLRHRLEHYMYIGVLPSNSRVSFKVPFGSTALSQVLRPKPTRNLKRYVQGFDKYALRVCKEMRSKISGFVVREHCMNLFAPENYDCDPFFISLANVERLVWEAVAFGGFLWDADEYVDREFNLRKNFKSTRMV